MEIWRDGARVFANTLRGLEGHRDAGEPLDFILKNTTFIWANSERTNKNVPKLA